MIGRFDYGASRLRTGTNVFSFALRPPLLISRHLSMRSSTILLLTLRALSQETIKNLVLSGVGRLIVMDDQKVSEVDLGSGLLLREEDGDVGKLVRFRFPAFSPIGKARKDESMS